jgi:hypothetical protein
MTVSDEVVHRFISRQKLAKRWDTTVRTLDRMHERRIGPRRIHLTPGRAVYCLDEVEEHERGTAAA